MKRVLVNHLELQKRKSSSELSDKLGVSERTLRTYVRELNEAQKENGFRIETIRGQGYELHITDQKKYEDYLVNNGFDEFAGNRKLRIPQLLYFLLQRTNYISIQEVADLLLVSRNTIERDLEMLRIFIKQLNLELEAKPHYGIRIAGSEKDVRQAFAKFVVNSSCYTSMTQPYFDFVQERNISHFADEIQARIANAGLVFTKATFESLLEHLSVLLYRVSNNNYISDLKIMNHQVPQIFNIVAQTIIDDLAAAYAVTIPDIEVTYLASQLHGKASVESIPAKDIDVLNTEIHRVLTMIDAEFMTDFSGDELLNHALLMHMYPLLTRIAHKISLRNPLIEFVSSRYANVFLVALRFVELWKGDQKVDLSRDEVGYLALHFASNLDRSKQKILQQFRRILILSELGRGNVMLLRQKVAEAFPKAHIAYDIDIDYEEINRNKPDLILTTMAIDKKQLVCPVYQINEIVSEKEITNLKDYLVLRYGGSSEISESEDVLDIFSEKFFLLTSSPHYLDVVHLMSKQMVAEGYADPSFPDSVMEREEHFSTIYENGVAGPHSMVLNAIKKAVGIIIPKESMMHMDKEVRIIFLINIYKGDLFMYREISKLLQRIIADQELLHQITNVKDFHQFNSVMRKMKY